MGERLPPKEERSGKGDTKNAFADLSDIAQDFYGKRSTEMFHRITKIYEESEEELEAPELEDEDDKVQDRIEYLN